MNLKKKLKRIRKFFDVPGFFTFRGTYAETLPSEEEMVKKNSKLIREIQESLKKQSEKKSD